MNPRCNLVMFSLALCLCFAVQAETVWHLEIPIPGSYRCPSNGTLNLPLITAARFADATATIKFMELSFTDDIGTRGRNYDTYAFVDSDNVLPFTTTSTTAHVGAGQIGRYTGGYPQVMPFHVSYNWDTSQFQFTTPGNGSVLFQNRNVLTLGPTGLFYARALIQSYDGDSGPLASNVKIKVHVACTTMPGAAMEPILLQNGALQVKWRPSPATEAVKQKLYRGPSDTGPWTLIGDYNENTTAAFADTSITSGTVHYKVVAEAAGAVLGAESNIVAVTVPETLKVTTITPAQSAVLTTVPNQISVDFNAQYTVPSATPDALALVRRGADGLWDTADDVVLAISQGRLNTATAQQLRIDLSGLTLPNDTYRLTLFGTSKGNMATHENYMSVPDFGLVMPGQELTVEFWQKFEAGVFHIPTTFGFEPLDNNNKCQVHSPWNSFDYFFWDFGTDRHAVQYVNTRGAWHHIAVVRSLSGQVSKIFLNGNLLSSAASNQAFVNYAAALQVPRWGAQPFIGKVDEFRVWNYARSSQQVATNYRRSLTGNEPGLVGYWNFNETSGATVLDHSPNAYNGTLTGDNPPRVMSDAPLLLGLQHASFGALDGDANMNAGGNFVSEFTIAVPAFTILTPNGGEVWYSGQPRDITWSAISITGSADLELSTDGGANWSPIATVDAQDQTYNWTVPAVESTECRVRIVAGANSDFSNANFTIGAPLKVTSLQPAPGATVTTALNSIVVTFSKNVSAAAVATGPIRLTHAGTDGLFDTADDQTISPQSVSVTGGNQLNINLAASIPNGAYKLRLVSNTVPPANPIAWWRLDEAAGNSATNDGTHSGTGTANPPVNWAPAKFNNGLQLTDATTYVEAPNGFGALGLSDFTAAIWIKSTDTNYAYLLGNRKVAAHGNFWQLSRNSSGNVGFEVDQDGAGTNYIGVNTTNAPVNDGNWHHLCATRQGNSVSIYVDGVFKVSATGAATANMTNATSIVFGNTPYIGSVPKFYGQMDDVRIYNRLLSASEIAALAAGPSLTDLLNVPMDGEYSGAFPTGNDTPGGDFVAQFTLQVAKLTVTSPNGGETWFAGESKNITWTRELYSGNIDIELSVDGGTNYSPIASSIPSGNLSYTWVVPSSPSTQCRIRIKDAGGAPSDESNTNFTLAVPTITVTSPNGGEAWQALSQHAITWTRLGYNGTVDIEFSSDGGANWIPVASGIPAANQTYSWTVIDSPSTNCIIRVKDTSGTPSDVSNAPFTIPAPSITVTAPNGGEVWTVGSQRTITWTSFGVANVKVELTRDGMQYETLAASVSAANGFYLWTVTGPFSSTCRVVVSDAADGTPADASNNTFTIPEPSVTVTAPNGGESWNVGAVKQIQWTSAAITNVKIQLSRDGGTNWETLTASVAAASGSYQWTVGGAGSVNCLILVAEAGSGTPVDASNAPFTIVYPSPVANNGSLNATEDIVANGTLTGTGAPGATLNYSIVGNGSKGTAFVTNPSTGAYTYTPNLNATGSDSFTFKITDGALESNTATINVTVAAVNDPPVGVTAGISPTEDTALLFQLQATDVDNVALTYSIATQPQLGSVQLLNAATGECRFTPTANANGQDSFTFTASDGSATSAPATISITIGAVNDVPVAVSAQAGTNEDVPLLLTLSASDADNDGLQFAIATQPASGQIVVLNPATGQCLYTPNPNANGIDSFTFTARDASVTSVPATQTIIITGVNDAPVGTPDHIDVSEDTAVTIQLKATDPDSTTLQFSIVQPPSLGELRLLNALTGECRYTPAAQANGIDVFTFSASDGTAVSVPATVLITITAANDVPAVVSGPTATPQAPKTGQVVQFAVTGQDPDGDALMYQWNFGDGTSAAGSTAAHAFTAPSTYTVEVTISDGKGGSTIHALTVIVTAPAVGGGIDTDGDGFDDQTEIEVGTSPSNAQDTPLGGAPIPENPEPLRLSAVAGKFNFAGGDTLAISGELPTPDGDVDGDLIILTVEGALRVFELDAKGKSSNGVDSMKLALKGKNGFAKFSIKLGKTDLVEELEAPAINGNESVKDKRVTAKISVISANKLHIKTAKLLWSVQAGKRGALKLAK